MRFVNFILIFIILLSSSLFSKDIDKKSIQIEELEADDNFFNNLQSIRDKLEEQYRISERKRIEIEELKLEIQKREDEIKSYEDSISNKIKSFSKSKSSKFKLRVMKLTKVFKTMKPKNVAKIIENLPNDLVISVFIRLKDEQVGKILKYLEPQKSAELSQELTEWKKRYKLEEGVK